MQYEAQTVPLWPIGRVSYGVITDGNNGALVKQRRSRLFPRELSGAAGRDVGDNLVTAVGERERICLRQVRSEAENMVTSRACRTCSVVLCSGCM